MKTKVVCAGAMVTDVLVQGVDDGIFSRDMTRVNAIELATGGDAYNQALNLAALGVEVELLGKVGVDNAGDILIAHAKNAGVETKRIVRSTQWPTSVSVVMMDGSGEHFFVSSKSGANAKLCFEDFDLSALDGAGIFSLGSLYGSVSLDGAVVAPLLNQAKRRGCITVLDMLHANPERFDDARRAFEYTDYLLPNEGEACLLTNCSNADDAAEKLLEAGVGCVIIKRGVKGCLIKKQGLTVDIAAFRAEKVIDTTGAGDAMVAGFISGLVDGLDVSAAARRGMAAGSIAVGFMGANGAIKSKRQLLELAEQE